MTNRKSYHRTSRDIKRVREDESGIKLKVGQTSMLLEQQVQQQKAAHALASTISTLNHISYHASAYAEQSIDNFEAQLADKIKQKNEEVAADIKEKRDALQRKEVELRAAVSRKEKLDVELQLKGEEEHR